MEFEKHADALNIDNSKYGDKIQKKRKINWLLNIFFFNLNIIIMNNFFGFFLKIVSEIQIKKYKKVYFVYTFSHN